MGHFIINNSLIHRVIFKAHMSLRTWAKWRNREQLDVRCFIEDLIFVVFKQNFTTILYLRILHLLLMINMTDVHKALRAIDCD